MGKKGPPGRPQAVQGHAFGTWIHRVTWLRFCRRCGLVWAKNARTQDAVRAGCAADQGD